MTSTAGLLGPTCRVALAAILHDLGKFAERSGVFEGHSAMDALIQSYCPIQQGDGGWYPHRHAANTVLAYNAIEQWIPDLPGSDTSPFTGRTSSEREIGNHPRDSLVNAAAAHHRPETFLQWIIATADRMASGFERDEFDRYNASRDERNGLNHHTLRQITLFEQLRLENQCGEEDSLEWRYPLAPLSPTSIFPKKASECEARNEASARDEYRRLWDSFRQGLERIPAAHRADASLWLDHFDSLWLAYTQAIPASISFGVTPDVSLYDHSHTTAALAAALWRWHEAAGDTGADAARRLRDRADFDTRKFLMVQGDFFGIQEFIFSQGGQTRRQAAKLLRGRSFQVSLFTELAALRTLETLALPPTSQIINAAGKFLIVAPNTPDTIRALEALRAELEQWFLNHAFGLAGIGLAWEPASCADLLGHRYGELSERLHNCLELAKYQRFSLCRSGARVFFETDYPYGPCGWNGRLPADRPENGEQPASCAISRDQILIGRALTEHERILVVPAENAAALNTGARLKKLEVSIFGYAVAFTDPDEVTGAFGALAATGSLRRCWDFSLPEASDVSTPWHGYARRFINGYVPRMDSSDLAVSTRYAGVAVDDISESGEMKTLDMLACEDRMLSSTGKWQGVAALGILKGDIDNLGELFRIGLRKPSFARHAALSRQISTFFTLWLPFQLAQKHRNIYTVFAGGDDFFLIGPWRSIQLVAKEMREAFSRYAAGNSDLHFSAGIATQKAGAPIAALAELADDALAAAKQRDGKDAVTCFGETVSWAQWPLIQAALGDLDSLRHELGGQLSTGYVYGLLQFVEARAREQQGDVNAAMWRSRFAYRTRRFVVDRLKERDEQRRRERYIRIAEQIAGRGIESLGGAYRIALYSYLYGSRDH